MNGNDTITSIESIPQVRSSRDAWPEAWTEAGGDNHALSKNIFTSPLSPFTTGPTTSPGGEGYPDTMVETGDSLRKGYSDLINIGSQLSPSYVIL